MSGVVEGIVDEVSHLGGWVGVVGGWASGWLVVRVSK